MSAEVTSPSPEETEGLGARLAATLGPGDVVALTGELGAGKTCFVQGIVRGLGVSGGATSPTFVLVNHYRGRMPVYHVDAYRIGGLSDLLDLGLEEMLDGDGVTVIEWADRLEPLLPARAVRVSIAGLGEEPRRIVVDDPRGAR
jgi:tRNA threonylcarbamoyladenosine biosynthesis protein TsaE